MVNIRSDVTNTERSPFLVVVTGPVAPTRSPRSTRSLTSANPNAAVAGSAGVRHDWSTINWIRPLWSASSMKIKRPKLRTCRIRPVTVTVAASSARASKLASTSALVCERWLVAGYGS
nr:hypothetical protein [Candidatus Microthrix parvicella]